MHHWTCPLSSVQVRTFQQSEDTEPRTKDTAGVRRLELRYKDDDGHALELREPTRVC